MKSRLLLLFLAGCATTGPYWVRVYEPVKLTAIKTVDRPCGRDWNGCNSRGTGVVQLRRGMSETERWCALGHEKKHLDGYDHPGHTHAFALDCGNGEML